MVGQPVIQVFLGREGRDNDWCGVMVLRGVLRISSRITWELISNTESQPYRTPAGSETLMGGPSSLCFSKPSVWSDAQESENHGSQDGCEEVARGRQIRGCVWNVEMKGLAYES